MLQASTICNLLINKNYEFSPREKEYKPIWLKGNDINNKELLLLNLNININIMILILIFINNNNKYKNLNNNNNNKLWIYKYINRNGLNK